MTVATERARPAEQGPNWGWIGVGIGSGLLLTLMVALAYRYLESRRDRDPRTDKVRELIEEAERLLAQGRRSLASRRKEED